MASEQPQLEAPKGWVIDVRIRWITLKLETLLQLLETLVDLLPLAPFLVILEATSDGKTGALGTTEVPHARKSLLQADHYPGVTNNLHIAPSTFEKLAAHPNIVGTKLSHGIIDDQTLIAASPNIDHEHFSVFTGLGQNLLPVLAIGGVGMYLPLSGTIWSWNEY